MVKVNILESTVFWDTGCDLIGLGWDTIYTIYTILGYDTIRYDWPEFSTCNIIASDIEKDELINSGQNWRNGLSKIWDEDNPSDHRPVWFKLIIEKKEIAYEINKPLQKEPKLTWTKEKHKIIYKEELEKILNEGDFKKIIVEEIDVKLRHEKLFNCINLQVLKAYSQAKDKIRKDRCEKIKRNPNEKSREWWSEELTILNKRKNFFKHRFRQSGKRIYKKLFITAKRHFKRLVRLNKKECSLKKITDLSNLFLKNRNFFWKNFGGLNKEVNDMNIEIDTLERHYTDLFNHCEKSTNSLNLEAEQREVVENYKKYVSSFAGKIEVSKEVLSNMMKSLKNNKKAGISGVKNEMFKAAWDTTVADEIAYLFEHIINTGIVPDNFNIGLLVTIIKNPLDSNSDINNSRPITVSETLATLFESLIEEELLSKTRLHNCQFGFRKNSSCAHALFTFKEACHSAKRKKQPLYVFFLGSKAFDKVNRIKLFYMLIDVMRPHMWLAFFNYYNVSKICIVQNGQYTNYIKTTVGVKQGGKASPFNFNIYVNPLVRVLAESELVFKIESVPVGVVVYADDTTLICKSKKDAREALKLVERYCELYDITINAKKTKWMSFNIKSNANFLLNGESIEKVKEFKLLGYIVTDNQSHKKHMKRRRALCIMAVKKLDDIGFREKKVNHKMKGLLYNSLCRSKLLYGIENTDLNTNELKELKSFDGNFIKIANGLSTRSKTTALCYSVGFSPLPIALLKRKISFIMQLYRNELTNALLVMARCQSIESTLYEIGYKFDNTNGKIDKNSCLALCRERLGDINKIEKELKSHELTICVDHLLKNRNDENDDTLQFLLDPRRVWPG